MPDHNGAYYRISVFSTPPGDTFTLKVTGWVEDATRRMSGYMSSGANWEKASGVGFRFSIQRSSASISAEKNH
jgi:hypothetical protein